MSTLDHHIHADSLWRPRFWAIFIGQAVSLIGSSLTQFVLMWWITDTTGDVAALAMAGVAAMLPQAILAPLGGTIADRHSRRMLMIGADLISALCMLVLIGLFASGEVELWHVYVMMSIRSAMQAFQGPAAAASVTMLVPEGFLVRAAGLNQAMQSITLIAAAPLGALAIGVMPMGWALGIDVITAVLGITPLLFFAIPQPRRSRAAQAASPSVWLDFKEGVALVWQNRGLRLLYALLGFVVLIIMPSYTLVPLLVKEHFDGGASQVALMEGLAGAGMLFGGVLVAVMAPQRKMWWILWGFASSCLALALTGLVSARLFGVAVAWWALSGITYVFGSAPLTALLQTIVPPHLQGRVLSLLNMIMGLAAPIGLAVVAPIGTAMSVNTLFVVLGVLGALASLAGFLSPTLMRLADDKIDLEGAALRKEDAHTG